MWELEKIKKLVETVPVIEENEGFWWGARWFIRETHWKQPRLPR
jgi:hypothetical protein